MAGQQRILWCSSLCLLLILAPSADAQPRTASTPIGGITFDPPRRATIRHKSGQLIRGDLIGISPTLVHFRVSNGKEFQYEFKDIRSIATTDGEFRYVSAHDTYRKAVEAARPLAGVKIDAVATTAAGAGLPPTLPSPPPPSLPVMLDSPANYTAFRVELDAPTGPANGAAQPIAQIPAIPPPPPAANGAAPAGASPPIYETGGFKIGFLIACFAVILLWWRNRVG